MAFITKVWSWVPYAVHLCAFFLVAANAQAQQETIQPALSIDFACGRLYSPSLSMSAGDPIENPNYSSLSLTELRGRVFDDPLAMVEMARREQLNSDPNIALVYGYLHSAQEKNSSVGALALSRLYLGTSGFPKDEGYRIYWLKRAADLGSIVACQEIGNLFHKKENHYDAVRYLGNIEALNGKHDAESLESLALSMSILLPNNETLTNPLLERSASQGSNAALFKLAGNFQKKSSAYESADRLLDLFSEHLRNTTQFNAHTLTSLLKILTEGKNLEKFAPISFGICVNMLHPTSAACRYLMENYREILTIEEMTEIQGLSAQQIIEMIHTRSKNEI